MPELIIIVLLAYTAVWALINLYNLYPLLGYYIKGKPTPRGGKKHLAAAQASKDIDTIACLPRRIGVALQHKENIPIRLPTQAY